MEHMALRHTINLAPQIAESPTEVYLLIMCEETVVKSVNSPIVCAAYHQTGTCCPHHFAHIVVLSFVFLNRFEKSAATERGAITVDVGKLQLQDDYP